MSARWDPQCYDPNSVFAGSNSRGPNLPGQYVHRRLLLGLEFGRLLIAELGVRETIERLRRAYAVQFVNDRSINGVRFAALVADSIADQQPAIPLIQIADPYLDRLGNTLFGR